MTFTVSTELQVDGQWVDISGDVYLRDGMTVTRGRRDEGARTDPAKLGLTLNNRNGRYSPRNPDSDLHGKIGRNTPIRVRQGARDRAVQLSGRDQVYASTPDTADLDITGDLDVRVEVTPYSWRPDEYQILAAKAGDDAAGDRSWALRILLDGRVELAWSEDGSTRIVEPSTAAVDGDAGRLAVRATLDVDNGSGAYEVTYYTAPDLAGPWTQLGTVLTGSAATSIYATTVDLTIGALASGDAYWVDGSPLRGLAHGLQVYDGIDGVRVVDVGFGDAEPGQDSFTDAGGRVWTLHGEARLRDLSVRMAGEVAAWPPRWDVSGTDVYTPLQAAGILRRLGNGSSPLRSTVYRGTVHRPDTDPRVVAYWPMEDGEDAVQLSSALSEAAPMTIVRNPTLADYDGWAASEPLPTLQDGQLVGVVPEYTSATDEHKLHFLLHIPESGLDGERRLLELRTTGTARLFRLESRPDGDLRMLVYSPTGALLDDTAFVDYNVVGLRVRLSVEIRQSGADVEYLFAVVEVGASDGGFTSRTITGATAGRIERVTFGAEHPDSLGDTAIGHVVVQDGIVSVFELARQTDAYRGEAAGRRIERLCREEGILFASTGDLDATAAMGPQGVDTLLGLIRECAEADGGILSELRDTVGLHYRTHESLYNRTTAVTLDYAAGEVAPPLEPVEDDQTLANDVAVRRRDGASARAVREIGPLSVLPPPDGVGRYDTSATLNLHADDQVAGQAQWRMHRGTIDQLRYPTVSVQATSLTTLARQVAELEPGDRFGIANPPGWLPPGTIDLTLEGTSEELSPFVWRWHANTSPADAHRVFELDHERYGRLASDGSELDTAVTDTDTTLSVAVVDGPLWTTDAAHLPLDVMVDGERMTVTGITGTTSPQTFTVTRGVDGVATSHDAGTEVQVADLGVLALGQSGENYS